MGTGAGNTQLGAGLWRNDERVKEPWPECSLGRMLLPLKSGASWSVNGPHLTG